MSYIVWDNDECHIYPKAEKAWVYIQPILDDNPQLKFYGFFDALSNINNHVAVLRHCDTKEPWRDYPKYLQPAEVKP